MSWGQPPPPGVPRRVLALLTLAAASLTLLVLVYLPAWIGGSSLIEAAASPLALRSLALSLAVSTVVTLLALAAAVPVGYALSRGLVPCPSAVEALLLLPFGMPPVALGAALFLALTGPLRPLEELLGLLYTPRGLVAAQLAVVYPIAVRAVKAGFDSVPYTVEVVSRSLGHSWARTMARVVLPMARRGIMTAAVLAFTRSLGEFGASVMVAGVRSDTMTLPIAIYSLVNSGDYLEGLALVAVSAAASLAGVAALLRLERRGGGW